MSDFDLYDPEDEGTNLDPFDPEDEGTGLDPFDPEDEGTDLPPFDPEDEGTDLPPFDPEDEGTDLPPFDPEDEGTNLPPFDPRARASSAATAGGDGGHCCCCHPPRRRSPRRRRPPRPPRRYSGDVIVRLSPLLPRPEDTDTDLLELAERFGLPGLATVLRRFGGPSTQRAILTPEEREQARERRLARQRELAAERGEACADGDSQDPPAEPAPRPNEVEHEAASLGDLEDRAGRSGYRPRHSLESYWRVAARNLEARGDNEERLAPEHGFPYSNAALTRRLVYELNELSEVDLAYREVAADDPTRHAGTDDAYVEPQEDELADHQFHLGEMPLGLDVAWLRRLLDKLDCELAVADLEQGWIVDHPDLPSVDLVEGDNRHGEGGYVGNHGAAVVSELAGRANRLGVIGFIPDSTRVKLASHYRIDGNGQASSGHVADSLVALMTGEQPALGPGDVVLLEVQRSGRPTEIDPLDFDAIRLAVGNGICVVEAAGNGNIDLDRLRTEDGRSLDRRSLDFSDSGAIVVGAASASPPHDRSRSSSYGSRVDCYAWGDSVVAAGYGDFLDGGGLDLYTHTFSGTSSASPMIAGAAVLLQSAYRVGAFPGHGSMDARSKSLSPREIRSILSNPRTGAPQGPGVAGHIGVMPDVRAILEESQRLVPQVYLRDHEGDEGATPYRLRACASPDIVVGKGEVRVRLRNRGLRTAEGVSARLYCAPVTTLVTPDRWRQLGGGDSEVTVPEGMVPQGDAPVESTALKVAETILQRSCLIAVVRKEGRFERPRGPEPQPASAFDWNDFRAALRSRNHFAMRNVLRVDFDPGSDRIPLPGFAVNGTPDVPRAFDLVLLQSLPEGAWLELRAPIGLGLEISKGRLWKPTRDGEDPDTVVLRLPVQPRLLLGRVALPARIDFGCELTVRNASGVTAGHRIALRQLYRRQEVGRITWELEARAG